MELIVYRVRDDHYAVCRGQFSSRDKVVPSKGEVVFSIFGPDPMFLAKEARKEAKQRGIQVQNLDKF